MQVTVEIPDEIVQRLNQTGEELSHRLLEVIVADAYRCGQVSTAEVGQILHLPSQLETHADRVTNTGLNFPRVNLLALAEGTLTLNSQTPTLGNGSSSTNSSDTPLFLPTQPTVLAHTFTLTSGRTLTGLNFGNQQISKPAPKNQSFFNFQQFTRTTAQLGSVIPYTPVELNGLQIPLLFDETYYRAKNSDVAQAVANGNFKSGYDHFIQFGWLEGRNPSILFDTQFYLSRNPDVAQAVANGAFKSGFQHFVLYGQAEKRNPSDLFDQQAYLVGNPDVADAVTKGGFSSAFDHYIEFGAAEGRAPNLSLFQEAFYLQQNPDVRTAVQNRFLRMGTSIIFNLGRKRAVAPVHSLMKIPISLFIQTWQMQCLQVFYPAVLLTTPCLAALKVGQQPEYERASPFGLISIPTGDRFYQSRSCSLLEKIG